MFQHLNLQEKIPERVVVIGGTGFVGKNVITQLEKAGICYICIGSSQVDLTTSESVEKLKKILLPADTVIFISAIAPCKDNEQLVLNTLMMKNFCEAIVALELNQVVYISSDAVYTEYDVLINEDTKTNPTSLHGVMHLARELMLKSALKNVPVAILRPSALYGEDDPHNSYGPNRFLRTALSECKIKLFGGGEEKRDHVYVEDFAKIILSVVLYRSEGVLNIATGNAISFFLIAETINKLLSKELLIQSSERQNPITNTNFDIKQLNKFFNNHKFCSIEAGLQKSLEKMEL